MPVRMSPRMILIRYLASNGVARSSRPNVMCCLAPGFPALAIASKAAAKSAIVSVRGPFDPEKVLCGASKVAMAEVCGVHFGLAGSR